MLLKTRLHKIKRTKVITMATINNCGWQKINEKGSDWLFAISRTAFKENILPASDKKRKKTKQKTKQRTNKEKKKQ